MKRLSLVLGETSTCLWRRLWRQTSVGWRRRSASTACSDSHRCRKTARLRRPEHRRGRHWSAWTLSRRRHQTTVSFVHSSTRWSADVAGRPWPDTGRARSFRGRGKCAEPGARRRDGPAGQRLTAAAKRTRTAWSTWSSTSSSWRTSLPSDAASPSLLASFDLYLIWSAYQHVNKAIVEQCNNLVGLQWLWVLFFLTSFWQTAVSYLCSIPPQRPQWKLKAMIPSGCRTRKAFTRGCTDHFAAGDIYNFKFMSAFRIWFPIRFNFPL